MNAVYDAIVIGAGQAGLAAGYRLQKAGLRFLILEAGDEPVGAWPHYYDSLLLVSPARYSALPGLPFPGDPNHYPVRDEVIAYLRSYAAHFALPVVTGARVSTLKRRDGIFRVTTAGRGQFVARSIVAATGSFGQPVLPDIAGRAHYRGRMLHTSAYANPASFHGQRIVVVGGANAAVQIGVELAGVARVTLATKHPIRYLPQHILGLDTHFWLRLTGLDRTQWLNGQSTPVYDNGRCRAAIAAGRLDRRPMFREFTPDGVIWGDGRHETIDGVIFATGYQPDLGYLAGLGAFDQAGHVLQDTGVSTNVPGLYYLGLARQRNFASATLRGAGADSKGVVDQLRRYCQTQKAQADRRSTGGALPRARGEMTPGLSG